MKKVLLAIFLLSGFLALSQDQIDSKLKAMPFEKALLKNFAHFKDFPDVYHGSAFLIKVDNDTIACTYREFNSTATCFDDRIMPDDFDEQLIEWKMYLRDSIECLAMVDSLILKKRIGYHLNFLTFSLKEISPEIHPLEVNMGKLRHNDSVYVLGYDNVLNQVRLVKCKINTAPLGPLLNKAYPEIRIETPEPLFMEGFIGGPILDLEGKAIGVILRYYHIDISKRETYDVLSGLSLRYILKNYNSQ